METIVGIKSGKSVLILSLVVGCFALLWPKIFFPMLQSSFTPAQGDATHEGQQSPGRRPPSHPAIRDAPPTAHAHLQNMARQPKRVMDRMARPGPMPGSRPTPGGYGAIPQSTKGGGTMGIIMPIYTIGIVVFFVYTILKVMFKNPEPSESKEPLISDYHLSTEYRTYGGHHTGRSVPDGSPAGRRRPVVVRRPPAQQEIPAAQKTAAPAASAPANATRPPPPVNAASNSVPATAAHTKAEDAEIDQLRRRLEETERAMERIMRQMSTVSEKLNVAKISSNIKAIKQDLWGSTDSVASDSMASERSLSMESLAQTEASLASLEEDVDKAAQEVKKKSSKDKNGHAAANGTKAADVAGRRRVQELKS